MKRKTKYGLISCLFLGLATLTAGELAHATNYGKDNEANARAEADASADAAATAAGGDGGSATASNEGNTLETGEVHVEGDNVENNSSTVVLVPNNNTESCVRVFGLAFGKNGESGALGLPWRSGACDYEEAGDDAAAIGDHETAWYWRCHKKNLYKPFLNRRPDVSRADENAEAIEACFTKMRGEQAKVDMIANLKLQLEFLNDEREIEREQCKESKQRIQKSWQESCGK